MHSPCNCRHNASYVYMKSDILEHVLDKNRTLKIMQFIFYLIRARPKNIRASYMSLFV